MPPDPTIRVWDARTGKRLAVFEGFNATVESVAFSPDGKRIVGTDNTGAIRVWDIGTKKQMLDIEPPPNTIASNKSVGFSPDGKTILCLNAGGFHAIVYDSMTGKEICRTPQGFMETAVFSPDAKTILTSSTDRIAQIWDATTGKEIRRFVGHRGFVHDAQFIEGAKRVVTGARDKMVKIWDPATGKELQSLPNPGAVDRIAIAAGRYCLALWEPNNGVEVPFGMTLWDLATGKEIRRFNHWDTEGLVGFAPDGKSFYTLGRQWQKSVMRNTQTGLVMRAGCIIAHDAYGLQGRENRVSNDFRAGSSWSETRFNPTLDWDGKRVLEARFQGISLCDTETGKTSALAGSGTPQDGAVAFSPDGKLIATASGGTKPSSEEPSTDRSLRLWNADDGKQVAQLEGAENPIETLQFCPDGKRILTTETGGAIRIWDVASRRGRLIATDTDGEARWSHDGRLVLALMDGCSKVRVLVVAKGRRLRDIAEKDGTGGFETAVFSPDGHSILTASLNGIAQIWDIRTGKETQRFVGHSGYVVDAYFTNDGSRIVTGGEDGTIRIWDAATGKELNNLHNAGTVCRTLLSPDCRYCLVKFNPTPDNGVGPNGSALWNLETGKQVIRLGTFNIADDGLIGFAPDSKSFLTVGWWIDGQLSELRSVETGQIIRSWNLGG